MASSSGNRLPAPTGTRRTTPTATNAPGEGVYLQTPAPVQRYTPLQQLRQDIIGKLTLYLPIGLTVERQEERLQAIHTLDYLFAEEDPVLAVMEEGLLST